MRIFCGFPVIHLRIAVGPEIRCRTINSVLVSKMHTVWTYTYVKHFLLSPMHCILCCSLTFSTLTDLIAWRPKKTKLKNYMFVTGSLECCVSRIISVMRIWSPTSWVIVKACHDIHVQKASWETQNVLCTVGLTRWNQQGSQLGFTQNKLHVLNVQDAIFESDFAQKM